MAATLIDYEGPIREPDSLDHYRVKIYGRHDDPKPTNVSDGSVFLEMDTTDIYMFDAVAVQWRKQ